MSEAEEVKLQIKVVINKEKTKVLFAEAGSEFTDILLSFLLLPLGTIVRVLENHCGDETPVIGSLSTLYNGVANIDRIHLCGGQVEELLTPFINHENALNRMRLNVSSPKPTSYVSNKTYGGILTDSAASFIIGDDLRLMPNSGGSIIKIMSNLGIAVTDMDGVEMRNVAFGLNEIMSLLRGSLVSQNPLSDLLFNRRPMSFATLKYERVNTMLLRQIDDKVASLNSKKMILTVTIQKSTKKLLFAHADHVFVNFLLGLLTLPLGKAEWYFDSNSGLKNIDNLHQSISADTFDVKFLKHPRCKGLIVNPSCFDPEFSSDFNALNFNPDFSRNHVKASRTYMVSDDLTVAPWSMTSCLAVLDGMKISLSSDVEELEVQVGLKEGLSILKAALTSTTALTDGLITPMLMKQEI